MFRPAYQLGFVALGLLLLWPGWAAGQGWGTGSDVVYDNFIFEETIRTVQFYSGSSEMNFPGMALNNQNPPLTLEFDELTNEASQFGVRVVHCDRDWTRSALAEVEYLEGMPENRIYDVQTSRNTKVHYVHYRYRFPGRNTRFKVSGNYALIVFRGNDPENSVLIRRFVVTENRASVRTDINRGSRSSGRLRLQRINFSVMPNDLQVNDPQRQFQAYMMQNFRWQTASRQLKPSYVYPDRLEYSFNAANEFEGGNEYRLVDLRSIFDRPSAKIDEIIYTDSVDWVTLEPDAPRTFNQYLSDPDFNGQFYISIRERDNVDYTADYFRVRFKLKMSEPLAQPVYVYGKLSDWRLLPDFQMRWSAEHEMYVTNVRLKQGFYDYQYVVKDGQQIDEQRLEGSHHQTENFYTILVYYRAPADRYDRLVGLRHVNYYKR